MYLLNEWPFSTLPAVTYMVPDSSYLINDTRPATCRQLAHRAQTRLIERRPRFVTSQQAHQHLLSSFLAASQQGDIRALLDALVKDMTEKAGHEIKESTTDASSRTRRKQRLLGIALYTAGRTRQSGTRTAV